MGVAREMITAGWKFSQSLAMEKAAFAHYNAPP
jgi:hypothetical protein